MEYNKPEMVGFSNMETFGDACSSTGSNAMNGSCTQDGNVAEWGCGSNGNNADATCYSVGNGAGTYKP